MRQELLNLHQVTVNKIYDRNEKLKREEETLKNDLNKIKQRLDEIKQERLSFEVKVARSKTYTADNGLCPICWVCDGFSAEFKSLSSDDGSDKFFCSHCNEPLIIREKTLSDYFQSKR